MVFVKVSEDVVYPFSAGILIVDVAHHLIDGFNDGKDFVQGDHSISVDIVDIERPP